MAGLGGIVHILVIVVAILYTTVKGVTAEEWTCWGACSVTCGTGTRMRTRSYDGENPEQEDQVQQEDCTEREKCPVDGAWGEWHDFSCSVTCGAGTKRKIRQCNNPIPQYGGHFCNGHHTSHELCFAGICPINGAWQPWGEFGGCSLTCGGGVRIRYRNCTPPQHGGKTCVGSNSSTVSCATQSCPVAGGWSDWSDWSGCSATCGHGESTRTRRCDNPPPDHNGEPCRGDPQETRPCHADILNCPVDGGWSEWSDWGPCRGRSCEGRKARRRLCDNPYPAHGGASCVGEPFDYAKCRQTTSRCATQG